MVDNDGSNDNEAEFTIPPSSEWDAERWALTLKNRADRLHRLIGLNAPLPVIENEMTLINKSLAGIRATLEGN